MSQFSLRFLASLACCFLLSSPLLAQPAEEELKVPDPENITLETKDRVPIHCTYYAGGFIETPGDKEKGKVKTKPGKEVVPIIMLHGWEGSRGDYDILASGLQRMGHAVIAPDLRGHGRSTSVRLANGEEKEIELDRLRRQDMEAGFLQDVEAVKKFLFEKNNAGELNIELLCVVGADVGAIVAVNWAALDWSRRQFPAFKQGRDVKALVLLSPTQTHKGFSLSKTIQHPVVRGGLSLMLVVGAQDKKALQDTEAVYSRVERFHADPPTDADERMKKQDLFKIEAPTSLQGTELLRARGLNVNVAIATFIDWRLVRKTEDYPAWAERKSPLGGE
jgi:pimeloyl-ACP methyl ester carboxylesterase